MLRGIKECFRENPADHVGIITKTAFPLCLEKAQGKAVVILK
jgi:hypothetical protein